MGITEFIILGLATWRISYLLVLERGLFGIAKHIRSYFRVHSYVETPEPDYPGLTITRCSSDNEIGKLLCCVYCVSVWIGALWLLLVTIIPEAWVAVHIFALSGLASLAHKVVSTE